MTIHLSFFYSTSMIVLYVFIVSAFYIHYRGKVRHRFFRQLSDHSTFLAPLNAFIYLFSAVPKNPFLASNYFPNLQSLEDHWQVIRDEGITLLTQGAIKTSDKRDDAGFNSFFKVGWSRFYVKWYGKCHPSAQKFCPKTVAWLKKIPEIKAAMFAYLPPGARLVRHRDPYAGSMRYHLGLKTSNCPQCHLVVDDQHYFWRDGEGIIFDETYIHYADNQTDQGRLILMCDVERPMRFIIPAWINRLVAAILLRAAASPNTTGDSTGWINRLFKWVYYLRIIGKKIKHKNKVVYYIIKWILFLALFYWLFF